MGPKRFAAAALRRLASGGSVLCLHSVTRLDSPAEAVIHVPAALLDSVVATAQLVGQIVPLRELVQRQEGGRPTAGLLALTFDDAYAALCDPAFDTFVRRQVPFTVFAVGEALRGGDRFWWDRVEYLCATVSSTRWRAFEEQCGVPAAYRGLLAQRFGPLRALRQFVLAQHRGRWQGELEEALLALEEEVGSRTAQRSSTFEELERLAALPWVTVGVHTLSHPVLPLLSDEELLREVGECYSVLRERFAATEPILAIPYGLFDRRTLDLAQAAGMIASATLAGRPLGARDGCGLPRFCVVRSEASWKLFLRITGVQQWISGRRQASAAEFPDLPSPTT
jgi:peptidoglycan/xylan/chitin deacetylase (PgdA/CDA1 family)